MDTGTIHLLHANIAAWCTRHASLLETLEKGAWEPGASEKIFHDLDALGVLHVLHDPSMRAEIATVAEIAYGFALHSPSLAALVVQQNMAAFLLGEVGAEGPSGWVALPVYDGPAEWAFQLRAQSALAGEGLTGVWRSFPALPIAERALVPIHTGKPERFALLCADFRELPGKVRRYDGVRQLGLRACPTGDLGFEGAVDATLLASGPEIEAAITTLWSQAEICILAIRAAIMERSYSVARDYAAVRWQGGKIIIEHSLIRKMLADFHLAQCQMTESWRSLARALEPGRPLTCGQMATALQSAEQAVRFASDGIQLLGGNGYMEDYGQERRFRDAKQCEMLLGHPQAKRFALWENP